MSTLTAPLPTLTSDDTPTRPPDNPLMANPVGHITSALERSLALIGDKYSLQIVQLLLQFGKQRFIELEDQINGISPRTLSARLKHLEAAGLLIRHQFATIPPKVEYRLTERGKLLAPVVLELCEWANEHYPCATPATPR
jgi:DNA-binding HxlR family transcriptional regulator